MEILKFPLNIWCNIKERQKAKLILIVLLTSQLRVNTPLLGQFLSEPLQNKSENINQGLKIKFESFNFCKCVFALIIIPQGAS